MSVSIEIQRGGETVESIPLSNQPFITDVYVPAAERLGLAWLPLIIRAAGLVVTAANRDEVTAELAAFDANADRLVRRSKARFILSVNEKIRRAILDKMTAEDVTVDIS
jgi:hypothetical protein